MQTRTHFDQIPVQTVKRMVGGENWQDLARKIQVESDPTKMIDLVERLIDKLDERDEKKAKHRPFATSEYKQHTE